MTAMTANQYREGGMTSEERMVIFASSLGTVFEWYDFYIYGSLAAIHRRRSSSPASIRRAAFIFTLLAFAAGFAVRPFGALVFGRLGDMVGRKYTFLITMCSWVSAPSLSASCRATRRSGIIAPVILIALRMAQGLALGGEYGGAAIYVAEHAPPTSAASTPRGSRPRRRSACSCRCCVILAFAALHGRSRLRSLGLAHSVPALDRPARRLGLDPAADCNEIAGLPAHEGRGQDVQGAADGGVRPMEERQDRAARAVRRSPPAKPWSGTLASSTRCSSCHRR